MEYRDACRIYALAGEKNFWRGFNYFETHQVVYTKQIDENHFECEVKGSQKENYKVVINVDKPKLSTCTCPYCDGHERRFCKHKVAAYLAIFPNEYNAVKKINDYYRQENEKMEEEYFAKLDKVQKRARQQAIDKVNKMSNEEIKETLINILADEYSSYETECLDEEYEEYFDQDYY